MFFDIVWNDKQLHIIQMYDMPDQVKRGELPHLASCM